MDPPSSGYARGLKAPTGEKPEAVRIWLLGGFWISVDSRIIGRDAWRLRKAAALVKLLALSPGYRLHREQALDVLWPDSGRRAASNSLRGALHAARKVLDPVAGLLYLASEEESLVLCPRGNLWIDVDAFEGAVATARRSRNPAAYRMALELYAGELLPDDRYEDWAEDRRQELRGTLLSMLIELAGLYEEGGDYIRVVETLQRLVSVESTNEEAHARLMRLHARFGRRRAALSQYDQLSRALSSRFGAEPNATTRCLRDEIAAGEFPPPLHSPAAPPQEGTSDLSKHNLPARRTRGEDIIGVLDSLGVLASAKGDPERSISYFSEALILSRGTGNVRRTATSLGSLGITMLIHGDPEQATVLLDESLVLFREIGDNSNIAISLMHSALAALARGDHRRVRVLSEEALKLLQRAEDRQHIADCLGIMAGAAGARGRARRAARLWGAAEALREEIGVLLQPENRVVLDPYITAARLSLGEVAWQAASAEGRAMTPERAIEYALSADEPASPSLVDHRSGGDSAVLTPRGKEVAALVAQGLTNRRIAAELSISEHTVATHIAKILKKLGLNSRSRLSAWVAERGMLPSEESDSRRY